MKKNKTLQTAVVTTLSLVAVIGLSARLTQSRPPAPPYIAKYNVRRITFVPPVPVGPLGNGTSGGVYVPVTLVPEYTTGSGSESDPVIVYAGTNNQANLALEFNAPGPQEIGESGAVNFYLDVTTVSSSPADQPSPAAVGMQPVAAAASAGVSDSGYAVTLGTQKTFHFVANNVGTSNITVYRIIIRGQGNPHRFGNVEKPLYIKVRPLPTP